MLPRSKFTSGLCQLCSLNVPRLERHHVLYTPERTIMLCHMCHFKVHKQPYALTQIQKERLAFAKLSDASVVTVTRCPSERERFLKRAIRYP